MLVYRISKPTAPAHGVCIATAAALHGDGCSQAKATAASGAVGGGVAHAGRADHCKATEACCGAEQQKRVAMQTSE